MEIVRTNLSGPKGKRAFYGERYFMLLIDDLTRIMWVAFVRDKSEALEKFRVFKSRVENESGPKIKILISYRGGEFISTSLTIFVKTMI